ncbi:MAG: UvrD-helicase domain-containing protein [Fibrobacter sp.]|nr:UvrD-helicase domain-containing protein [Fibrobacter sp.]
MNNLNPFDISSIAPDKPLKDQFIEASAGTGKTFTIRKISAELVKRGIPLSEVLFVTYTEKAAGEMRDRIREEMSECLADAKNPRDKALFERACQDVDKAVIGTIHSFCRKTLHDFAYEADVPFDMDNADDQAIKVIIDRFIRDKWASEIVKLCAMQENPEKAKPLPKYVDHVRDLFVSAIKEYSPEKKSNVLCSSVEEWFAIHPEANDHWNVLNRHKAEIYTAISNRRENEYQVADLINKIKAWPGGKTKLFTSQGTQLTGDLNSELGKALSYFFALCQSNPIKLSSKSNVEKYSFLNEKTRELYDLWQKEKVSQKQQSFNDMITSVREAVCPNGQIPAEPTILCKKLRATYKIAIIDEFQDTNEYQWNIFEPVFLNSAENYLIVVGDPKQSIYSFQGADLQVYRCATECIKNGSALKTNFRSSISMIEACNLIFQKGDDTRYAFLPKGDFESSLVPDKPKFQRQNALFNGNPETAPIWVSPIVPEKGFARFAVQQIIDCCRVQDGKTALQIFDRGADTPKNVNFSDFAILGRTRPEMDEIKKCLAAVGVPFVQYKDTSLFDSRECTEWISVLKMLAAPNLTGFNTKLLNSVFVTDFFGIDLAELTDDPQKNADKETLLKIAHWRQLAAKKLWTELQEQIYEDTQVEKRLSTPSTLQELMKLRQIGNYIFGYLYEKKASLQQAVKHLETLASDSKKAGDEDGNIVAKGTDFKAVKLMTIHASKGLEFPVVISCAGFKGVNPNAKGPFVFGVDESEDGDGTVLQTKYFGFDDESKKNRQKEETAEWHRLLYVDYTRASSLLILPQYDRWYKCEKIGNSPQKMTRYHLKMNKLILENGKEVIDDKGAWSYLAYAHREICNDKKYAELREWMGDWDVEKLKKIVEEELKCFNENESPDKSELPNDEVLEKLHQAIKDSSLFQHSYSSIDKKSSGIEIESIDGIPQNVSDEPVETEESETVNEISDYPRGNLYGDALHHIFEKLDFVEIGKMPLDNAQSDSKLKQLVTDSFLSQGLPIGRHPDWMTKTINIVWNTMNAVFPEIHGSQKTGESFKLNELDSNKRRAEMEFRLKANEKGGVVADRLKTFCKGFMDLVFVREDNSGCPYYSVLDWKSNLLAKYDSVASFEAVRDHYSIQMVLYSYCLIQWLSCIMHKEPKAVFNENFGGIYYVFARGCKEDEGDGIYAHTWESFDKLKSAYEELEGKMYE